MEISRDVFLSAYKDANVNVVGLAITPWHALGVKSFVNKLKNEGLFIGGIVGMMPHSKTGMCINENIFNGTGLVAMKLSPIEGISEQIKVAVRRVKLFREQKKELFNNEPPLFVLCPSFPGSYIRQPVQDAGSRKLIFLQIDEGLSAYMLNSRDWIEKSISDRNLRGLKAFFRRCLGLYDESYFSWCKEVLADEGRFMRWMLLNEDMTPSREVIYWYKKTLLDEIPEADLGQVSHYEGAIIVNTQPLVEDGVVNRSKYLSVLQALVDVARRRGRSVVIKPHPREANKDDYKILKGCWLDDNGGIAQESLIASCKNKPIAVVGFNSSTLLTSNLFFDIPTVSIISILNNIGGIIDSEDVLCNRFEDVFSRSIFFPSNIEEFEAFCSELSD